MTQRPYTLTGENHGATVIGGHFGLGFIWASPVGGWEYPLRFSVGQILIDAGRMPGGMRWLVVRER